MHLRIYIGAMAIAPTVKCATHKSKNMKFPKLAIVLVLWMFAKNLRLSPRLFVNAHGAMTFASLVISIDGFWQYISDISKLNHVKLSAC